MSGDQANQLMVDRMVAEGALWSRALIAAFRATPRHRFLDRVYHYHRKRNRWREVLTREPGEAELRLIYSDRALITHLSTRSRNAAEVPVSSSSQPSLMGQMLEDFMLTPGLRVLEVGAGTGYNAALIAFVVNPGLVTSIDVDRKVLFEAWDHLRSFPDRKVEVKHADGRHGYAETAPFDRIMVTAATPDLEPAWLEQLADGGILLAPMLLAPSLAFIVRGTMCRGIFQGRLTRAAYFMPLRAEGEAGEAEERPWPQPTDLQTVAAPWAGWFDRRRPRSNWLDFIQALVFFGLLKGLDVQYRTLSEKEAFYGINDRGSVCWFGAEEWQVNSDSARQLGCGLWHAFLDAGGPRPMDYSLTASPEIRKGVARETGYYRRGNRCHQYWELVEPIERGVAFD